MSNDINTLRDHLFAALDGLKNNTIDINQAKAICEVGQVIINTAKVEVQYLEAAGGTGTGFVPSIGMHNHTNATTTEPSTPIAAITRNYLK